MINRDRRKIAASIFADVAKYSFTAGVLGTVISGKISLPHLLALGLIAGVFSFPAYFVTPKDNAKKEK